MVKERPIIFTTESVKAILDGRKTQTRRVVKPQPEFDAGYIGGWVYKTKKQTMSIESFNEHRYADIGCPHGQIGDRLWVREGLVRYNDMWYYKADWKSTGKSWVEYVPSQQHLDRLGWQYTSRMMPRIFSRITLEITGVRVERLQEISDEDCFAEGVKFSIKMKEPSAIFRDLWDSINGKKYPWMSNPWVWVVRFDNIGVRVK